MEYKLAKELKDAGNKWIAAKQCADCEKHYIGGHKSFRCKPCQKTVRRVSNPKWQKSYYDKNRERILDRHIAHQNFKRATDPMWREKELTKGHLRRSRIEGNGGTHTTEEWIALVRQHDGRCAHCLLKKPLTRDHIVPLSRGGTNEISNIQPLCGSCNSSKGAKLV